jgi:hypothetical protein
MCLVLTSVQLLTSSSSGDTSASQDDNSLAPARFDILGDSIKASLSECGWRTAITHRGLFLAHFAIKPARATRSRLILVFASSTYFDGNGSKNNAASSRDADCACMQNAGCEQR